MERHNKKCNLDCGWQIKGECFKPANTECRGPSSPAKDIREAMAENDVVQVVRCKNCAFSNKQIEFKNLYVCLQNERFVKKNDFCSYGERKTDNA